MLTREFPFVAAKWDNKLVVFVLSSDETKVHVYSPDIRFGAFTMLWNDFLSLKMEVVSFEHEDFSSFPMIIGREFSMVRGFLKAVGLAYGSGYDEDPYSTTLSMFNWEWYESYEDNKINLRSSEKNSGRWWDDSKHVFLAWWRDDTMTFVCGGVRGDVETNKLVNWDERYLTTRRDREGKAAIFCDPSPASRKSRENWTKHWPRVICINSFGLVGAEKIQKHHVRFMSFVQHRSSLLLSWLDSDEKFENSPESKEEQETISFLEEAENMLPKIIQSGEQKKWNEYHSELVRQFRQDSEKIQRIDDELQAKYDENFKDDLGTRRSKRGKAALNARRRVIIRRFRAQGMKRWPDYKSLYGKLDTKFHIT